jgi:hypothetical protein
VGRGSGDVSVASRDAVEVAVGSILTSNVPQPANIIEILAISSISLDDG